MPCRSGCGIRLLTNCVRNFTSMNSTNFGIWWWFAGLTHLRPSAAYMRQWICSAIVQIMDCRLEGAKPFSEPMLTYCQLDHMEHISMEFHLKFKYSQSWNCVCRCCLRNGGHFAQWEMSHAPIFQSSKRNLTLWGVHLYLHMILTNNFHNSEIEFDRLIICENHSLFKWKIE